MIMKLVHAIAALLTVLLVFIKQGYTYTTGMKLRGVSYSQSSCEVLTSPVERPPADERRNGCTVCARSRPASRSRCGQYSRCAPPKCKRDPEINVDNEEIGTQPCDQ